MTSSLKKYNDTNINNLIKEALDLSEAFSSYGCKKNKKMI